MLGADPECNCVISPAQDVPLCVEVTEHAFEGTEQGPVSPPLCLGGLRPDMGHLPSPGRTGLHPGAIAEVMNGHCSLNGLLTS